MMDYQTKGVRRQRGVSLTIILILLLIMTLLGLASMRAALMQEKMGAGQFDRSLSFQAAEAAMRDAEAVIATNPTPTFPATGAACAAGLCPQPPLTAANRWDNTCNPPATGCPWAVATTDVDQDGLTVAPQYMIEYMGETPKSITTIGVLDGDPPIMLKVYRITTRSTQANRATVIIQSNFTKP
ncbi:MAG: pilus assembly PilX family protein [Arenimonas sp.]